MNNDFTEEKRGLLSAALEAEDSIEYENNNHSSDNFINSGIEAPAFEELGTNTKEEKLNNEENTTNKDSLWTRFRNSRYTILLICTWGVFIDELSYGVVIPLLPYYEKELGITDQQVGLLVSSFAMGSFAVQPFLGIFSDRFGVRGPLIFGLLLSGLATIAYTFVNGLPLLIVARVLQGLGSAFTWTSAMPCIVDEFPAEEMALAMSVTNAASYIGNLMGPPTGGFLFDLFGYKSPFLLIGSFCLLDAFARVVILPSKTPGQTSNKEEPDGEEDQKELEEGNDNNLQEEEEEPEQEQRDGEQESLEDRMEKGKVSVPISVEKHERHERHHDGKRHQTPTSVPYHEHHPKSGLHHEVQSAPSGNHHRTNVSGGVVWAASRRGNLGGNWAVGKKRRNSMDIHMKRSRKVREEFGFLKDERGKKKRPRSISDTHLIFFQGTRDHAGGVRSRERNRKFSNAHPTPPSSPHIFSIQSHGVFDREVNKENEKISKERKGSLLAQSRRVEEEDNKSIISDNGDAIEATECDGAVDKEDELYDEEELNETEEPNSEEWKGRNPYFIVFEPLLQILFASYILLAIYVEFNATIFPLHFSSVFDFSPTQTGIMFAINGIASALSSVACGYLTDKYNLDQKYLLVFGMMMTGFVTPFLALPGLLWGDLVHNDSGSNTKVAIQALLGTLQLLAGTGFGIWGTVPYGLLGNLIETKIKTPVKLTGFLYGYMGSMYTLGMIVGPLFAGFIVDKMGVKKMVYVLLIPSSLIILLALATLFFYGPSYKRMEKRYF